MTDWRNDIETALDDFVCVATLAGVSIDRAEFVIEYLPAPHLPPKNLPTGKMASYGFFGDGEWLKIGKAGPNSAARYTYQHYNAGSARSTLAASLANNPRMQAVVGFDPHDPGGWIKTAAHRVNILLPAERSHELLSLLEAFLHVRLKPRYEG